MTSGMEIRISSVQTVLADVDEPTAGMNDKMLPD